jgi:hypothetical protein
MPLDQSFEPSEHLQTLPQPEEMSEPDWIRYRMRRLEALLPFVTDERALHVIADMMQECRHRLRRIGQRPG